MSVKKSNDAIGQRTRDLPTCSAVSQPSTTTVFNCTTVTNSCVIDSIFTYGRKNDKCILSFKILKKVIFDSILYNFRVPGVCKLIFFLPKLHYSTKRETLSHVSDNIDNRLQGARMYATRHTAVAQKFVNCEWYTIKASTSLKQCIFMARQP